MPERFETRILTRSVKNRKTTTKYKRSIAFVQRWRKG